MNSNSFNNKRASEDFPEDSEYGEKRQKLQIEVEESQEIKDLMTRFANDLTIPNKDRAAGRINDLKKIDAINIFLCIHLTDEQYELQENFILDYFTLGHILAEFVDEIFLMKLMLDYCVPDVVVTAVTETPVSEDCNIIDCAYIDNIPYQLRDKATDLMMEWDKDEELVAIVNKNPVQHKTPFVDNTNWDNRDFEEPFCNYREIVPFLTFYQNHHLKCGKSTVAVDSFLSVTY
jgi:hypothetical protein